MTLGRAVRIAFFVVGVVTVGTLLSGTAVAQVLIKDTTARFDWQPASGNVEFYEVWVSRSSREGHYEIEQTVTVPYAFIDAGLGEVVRIRVRAGNSTVFGPMSPPSDAVRLGLPTELPVVGTLGVINGRAAGSDTGDVFYADPETDSVWRFSTLDPSADSVEIGSESDPGWKIGASGDFDGDGASDLFWHHTNGATRIWYIDGTSYEEEPGPLCPGPLWVVETTGDFDGNGQDDLFWREPAGPTLAWLRTGVDFGLVYFPPVSSAVWELLSVGDFDGDGFDDLFWRNLNTTDTAVWFTANDPYNGLYAQVRASKKRSLLWEVFESRDEDNDGIEDVHWRVRNSHDVSEWWYMDGENVRTD